MPDLDKCIDHLADGWSDDEVSIASFAIHRFGSNQHPAVERKTLSHFRVNYLLKCLVAVRDCDYITNQGEKLAELLIFKLENPPMEVAEYINDYNGLVCPVCRENKGNLHTDEVEQNGKSLFQRTACTKCGAIWTDQYKLWDFSMNS